MKFNHWLLGGAVIILIVLMFCLENRWRYTESIKKNLRTKKEKNNQTQLTVKKKNEIRVSIYLLISLGKYLLTYLSKNYNNKPSNKYLHTRFFFYFSFREANLLLEPKWISIWAHSEGAFSRQIQMHNRYLPIAHL